jgi:hypothetical protein
LNTSVQFSQLEIKSVREIPLEPAIQSLSGKPPEQWKAAKYAGSSERIGKKHSQ